MDNRTACERYKIGKDGYSAEINALGAELKSFRNDTAGTEYIWYADPMYWNESAPWLFPLVCDLRNNQTIIDGRIYSMPIHGFACRMPFELVDKADDRICLRLSDTPETLSQYPFHFSFEISYKIDIGRLGIDLKVLNKNEADMPFFIGGHFGINCPMFKDERFEDMAVEFEHEEDVSLPRLDGEHRIVMTKIENMHFRGKRLELHYDMFDHDALMFPELKSRSVKLVNKTGKGLKVDFRGFEKLGVWTWPGKTAPYVCIEPWNGIGICDDEDDMFIHKRNVQYAAPGEIKTYHLELSEV